MKKTIYIIAAVIFGTLLLFLAHAWLEIFIIKLLVKDFARYSLGFSWDTWLLIHAIGTYLFIIAGAILGYFFGQTGWRILYVEKRYQKRWWKSGRVETNQ